MSQRSTPASWMDAARRHARKRPFTVAGLAASSLAVLFLLAQSIAHIFLGDAPEATWLALSGGMAAFAATASGAIPVVVVRSMPQKLEDTMLGFAAGMMLAASSFSLILPGLAAAQEITGGDLSAAGIVVLGMGLGVVLMLGLEEFTPHEHENLGPQGPGYERLGRVWLFVFAIVLHNLPEGMAIGVGFSHADMAVGVPLTTAIAIQDIPEGLAVALAMRSAGFSTRTAALAGVGSGAVEPIGALLGVGLSSGFAAAYPLGLGLAAGAMLFVVSHEVIPETHRNGHQTPATVGLMGGFALMMVLDTVLG
ncbi:MAG: ZIP family metal transporter [Rhodospirillaceae bacterium]